MAGDYVTVKIANDVARDARIVAACRQITLAEYLSESLRPCVSRDLRKELLDRSNEHQKLEAESVASSAGGERLVGAGEQDGQGVG